MDGTIAALEEISKIVASKGGNRVFGNNYDHGQNYYLQVLIQ